MHRYYAIIAALVLSWPLTTQAQFVNTIWAGYVVPSGLQTQVSASWNVPTCSLLAGQSLSAEQQWIGIGGRNHAGNLIQIGTACVASSADSSKNSISAQYDTLPGSATTIPITVHAGDNISASITCTANCSLNVTQTWFLSITDNTTSSSWTDSINYKDNNDSAEWFVESDVPSLAWFSTVIFTGVQNNNSTPSLTYVTNSMIMEPGAGNGGNTVNVSQPTWDGDFAACWYSTPGVALGICTFGNAMSGGLRK